jgi:hypothetical protein
VDGSRIETKSAPPTSVDGVYRSLVHYRYLHDYDFGEVEMKKAFGVTKDQVPDRVWLQLVDIKWMIISEIRKRVVASCCAGLWDIALCYALRMDAPVLMTPVRQEIIPSKLVHPLDVT